MSHYRELTVLAVVLGVIQGIVLNVAFVYATLKIGFSIGGSTVAAIMGSFFLKGVFKKGTSIENNINQTVASGINTSGSGVTFTLPAIFLLATNIGLSFNITDNMLALSLAALSGAILGVVVIVPLRKQMIEIDRLKFPSGIATATIIRTASGNGSRKAKLLLVGFVISALVKVFMDLGYFDVEGVIAHEELNFGFGLIPEYASPFIYLSLMNVAAGMLAGSGGLAFLIAGILAWWFISPLVVWLGWAKFDATTPLVDGIYSQMLRPLGIGVLIGGAIMGLVLTAPAIKAAFISLIASAKTKSTDDGIEELPLTALVVGAIIGVSLLLASCLSFGLPLFKSLLLCVLGIIWISIAAIIVAQSTGMTDISPLSGMALITVAGAMYFLDKNVTVSLALAMCVCVAIGQAADMMQDLKTGFLLGGSPRKQQLIQFLVSWIGALCAMAVVYILWVGGPGGQGGFGPGTPLPAPQASVLKGIVELIQSGNIPTDKYLMGALLGCAMSLAPVAGMGVLAGLAFYLPFSITLGYGVGCFLTIWLVRIKGKQIYEETIVPLGAGLIVGEAIAGIVFTGFKIFERMG